MDDKVLSKIRKLLALAEGNDNVNESSAAIAQAQRLMTRHGIEASMLAAEQNEPDEEIVNFSDDPLHAHSYIAQWRCDLASTLARANGSRIYLSGGDIKIVGRPSDVSKVRYLFAYCEREIQRLVRAHNAGHGATWCNNFRLGCVSAIREAIKREKESLFTEMRDGRTGRELVVVNNAIAKTEKQGSEVSMWMKRNMRLGTRAASGGRSDVGGFNAGRRAGASIYPGSRSGIASGAKRISG